MSTMRDEDVGPLLKELPRHQASSDFTERVMGRLDHEPSRSRPPRRRLAWVAAAVLVVGTVAFTSHTLRQREERRLAETRLEEMRREYRALEAELEQLRSLTSDVEPVLELGGTDELDFIFDGRRFAERSGARAEPVSHTTR